MHHVIADADQLCGCRRGAPSPCRRGVRARRGSPAAFTLIELLAAVLVMTILTLLIFTAYHQGQRGWTHGQKRAEAYRDGRKVIGRIAEEVALAVATNFQASGNSLTFVAPLSWSHTTPVANLNGIEQTDLCWVKYEYVTAGTTPLTYGYVRRTAMYPRGDMVANGKWRNAVYFNNCTDTTWQQPVTDTNVLACTFTAAGAGALPPAVRIRIETLDKTTLAQAIAANDANLTNLNRRLLEPQVRLVNGP
jgi:type II secretory pathway component PulJ